MTLYKPTLQLRKLRVLREKRIAYQADFHEGVNIIRGQNASGKSTVVDFIFYALGGDGVPWKSEDHQIIFATSQIAPSLQDGDLVVGKASTVDDKTLAIG